MYAAMNVKIDTFSKQKDFFEIINLFYKAINEKRNVAVICYDHHMQPGIMIPWVIEYLTS